MREITLMNGRGVTYVDDGDFEALSQYRWCLGLGGYRRGARCVQRSTMVCGRPSSIKMHRQILGLASDDDRVVDHINGDALDNRRCNLRICSQRQNLWNRKMKEGGSKTGVRGVRFLAGRPKPWHPVLTFYGRPISLGYFASLEEATRVREKFERLYFGEYASSQPVSGSVLPTAAPSDPSRPHSGLLALLGHKP